MELRINFNKPYFTGKENVYINQSLENGHISGNGIFTKKCHHFFKENYGFRNSLLTTSCTDALEMAAILLKIKDGDEIIMPSYTFVSTANAFVLRGAKIIFADSRKDQPNIDESQIESLITSKTKAIVVVHYAGMACEMDTIMSIATKNNLYVVEDAAQAIDGFYKGKPLGSFGHLSTFSFHETKNIISGEGGLLVVNDDEFWNRAEIIWEKGTNRSAFFRGEIDKYGWVDIGSSFLPSDITAAVLFSQLECIRNIQQRRIEIWNKYFSELQVLKQKTLVRLPIVPSGSSNNAHMFYLICQSEKERDDLIKYLKKYGIKAVFHYQSLYKSNYFSDKHEGEVLCQSDLYSQRLIRLPFFYDLNDSAIKYISNTIKEFYLN